MLSTIHSRALARLARSARCHLRLSPIARAASASPRDGGCGIASPTPANNNDAKKCHYPPSSKQPRPKENMPTSSMLACGGRGSFSSSPSFPGNGPNNGRVVARRTNFTYAGPRKLSDILKPELLADRSSSEISEIWEAYHEGKEKVHGLTLDKARGRSVLARAAQCPFFIHPLFREGGHFMLVSQFQSPNYFLLAYLEDYRADPARAQPLLTISVFEDMSDSKGVALVRCDVINRGIDEVEGLVVCKSLLNDYADEDDFRIVHTFNRMPDAFDLDAFVREKERRWKGGEEGA